MPSRLLRLQEIQFEARYQVFMSFDQTRFVWMNGEIIQWQNATVHVSSHTLHYGSGVFEGMRCYETEDGPAVFRMDEHLDRLYASARVYGIEIPYTKKEIAEATLELIRCNDFKNCYVRHICYLGSASLGLHPRDCPVEFVILAWPWAPYLGVEGLTQGVRVTISPWLKFHPRMMPTTAKACGQYLNSILAVREAVSRGYAEALLLDMDGSIAEASGMNLFIVRDEKLVTNDEHHSILLGITRESVIEIGRDLGYPIEIRDLQLNDLLTADEAFLTGTAAEVTPIREVDGTTIGRRCPGEVTANIQRIFFAATLGRREEYRHWLRPVNESARGHGPKTIRLRSHQEVS
jgi:branched-chain amino acid aminotransferase